MEYLYGVINFITEPLKFYPDIISSKFNEYFCCSPHSNVLVVDTSAVISLYSFHMYIQAIEHVRRVVFVELLRKVSVNGQDRYSPPVTVNRGEIVHHNVSQFHMNIAEHWAITT